MGDVQEDTQTQRAPAPFSSGHMETFNTLRFLVFLMYLFGWTGSSLRHVSS